MSDQAEIAVHESQPEQAETTELTPEEQAVALLEAPPEEAASETVTEDSAKEAEPEKEEPEPEKTKDSDAEKKAQRLSRAMQDMARMEHQNRQLQARLDDMQKQVAQANEVLELARSNPRAFFDKAGIDEVKFADGVLANDKPDPVKSELQRIKEEIASLKSERKADTDRWQQQRAAQAQAQHQEQLLAYVQDNSSTYPLLAAYEPADIKAGMWQVLEEHYRQTGSILDPSAAAARLNKEIESVYQRLQRAAQRKSGDAESTAARPVATTGQRTLSNGAHVSRTTKTPDDMSEEERIALAASMLSAAE